MKFSSSVWLGLVFLVSAVGFAEDKQPDYWANIRMNMNVVRDILTPDHCYQDERHFLGCVAAVEALAAAVAKNQVILAPSGFSGVESCQTQILAEFGQIKLLEEIGEGCRIQGQPIEVLRKNNEEGRIRYAAWSVEFQNTRKKGFWFTKDKRIAFGEIFQSVKGLLSTARIDSEAALAGSALNEYMHMRFDPHSDYRPKEFLSGLSGDKSLVGIGVTLGKFSSGFRVESVILGGPAEKAGVKPGDVMTQIDSVVIAPDMSLQKVISMIRGEEGTHVVISVMRGADTLRLEITRAIIKISNVEYQLIESGDLRVAQVKIRSFMNMENRLAVCPQVAESLMKALQAKANAFVLDLRDNGGGRLDEAACILGLLLGSDKKFLTIRGVDGNNYEKSLNTRVPGRTIRKGILEVFPTTVLVDSGSASASEIVAGVIQDYQGAYIVGRRTFGKGSVQAQRTLNNWVGTASDINSILDQAGVLTDSDHLLLALTQELYYLPSGRTPQIYGVTPDIEVAIDPKATELREEDLSLNPRHSVIPQDPYLSPYKDLGELKNCILAKQTEKPRVYADSLEFDTSMRAFECMVEKAKSAQAIP